MISSYVILIVLISITGILFFGAIFYYIFFSEKKVYRTKSDSVKKYSTNISQAPVNKPDQNSLPNKTIPTNPVDKSGKNIK